MIETVTCQISADWTPKQIEQIKLAADRHAWKEVCDYYGLPLWDSASKMAHVSEKLHIRSFRTPERPVEWGDKDDTELAIVVIAAWRNFEDARPGDLVVGHEIEQLNEEYTHRCLRRQDSAENQYSSESIAVETKQFAAQVFKILVKEDGVVKEKLFKNYWKRI